MAPTFESGARVFTTPLNAPLKRGDIVLVDDGRGEFALKRVIGLPGETIKLWRGYVFVNCRMLSEPYLPKYTFTFPCQKPSVTRFSLWPGQYFVLGDNRLYSVDSRSYGPIDETQIRGRVPSPRNMVRPKLAPYTLPSPGKTGIQSVEDSDSGIPAELD